MHHFRNIRACFAQAGCQAISFPKFLWLTWLLDQPVSCRAERSQHPISDSVIGASEVFPTISLVPDDRSKSSRLCRHGSIQLPFEFFATNLHVAGPGQLAPGQLEVLRPSSFGPRSAVSTKKAVHFQLYFDHADAALPPLRSWKGHRLHNGAGYVLIQCLFVQRTHFVCRRCLCL